MNKEWENEPDREDFEAHGLQCLVLRHSSLKHLCGYVGVPENHPQHGKDYNTIEFGGDDDDWWPHGGLTYARDGSPTDEKNGLWWFGFDCCHSGDFVPGMDEDFSYGTYRNFGYVKREVEHLAARLTQQEPSK